MLTAMNVDFVRQTKITLKEHLHAKHFGERFCDELASAIVNVNYGQNIDQVSGGYYWVC
jgi:hypothetical protein